jgi:hypothetical protein
MKRKNRMGSTLDARRLLLHLGLDHRGCFDPRRRGHNAPTAQQRERHAEHVQGRRQENARIEPQAQAFDEEPIELQLAADAFEIGVRRELDLGETGDAGQHRVAFVVTGNCLGKLADEFGALRPRPDQAHLAQQHVEKLRQFVDVRAAQQPADRGHARVAGDGPARAGQRFTFVEHGANLVDGERDTASAGARLRVERRPARAELHRQRRQEDDRQRNQ